MTETKELKQKRRVFNMGSDGKYIDIEDWLIEEEEGSFYGGSIAG